MLPLDIPNSAAAPPDRERNIAGLSNLFVIITSICLPFFGLVTTTFEFMGKAFEAPYIPSSGSVP